MEIQEGGAGEAREGQLFWLKNLNLNFWKIDPAMVAEWVYERLQIQVTENQRSQVRIPLGTHIHAIFGCIFDIFLWHYLSGCQ